MLMPREGPKTPPEKRIAFLEESVVKTLIMRSWEETLVNRIGRGTIPQASYV